MKTKGLYFRKFDLHIHTPASECFKDKDITPEQIVQESIKKELSAIAITDHNTGVWIDKVKKAAKDTNLTIFPGVEINVGDAHNHIIAVLDIDKGTKDIEGLLSTIGILHDKFGKKDAFSSKSVNEVIKEITNNKFNGIAILAHIDSTNGVFEQMLGEPRKEVIQNPKLLAVEAINYKKVSGFLDGTDQNYQRKLAIYQSSDNPCLDKNGNLDKNGPNAGKHSIEGIGYRYSYFKVDENISLESLRQCFIDPDVRIRQSFEYTENVFPYIKKLKINSGFLADEEFIFHHGLNSILGAKGAGKSLLVEFLRFGLDQESTQDDISKDHNEKLSQQLRQYGQVEIDICDETGKEFKITRTYDPIENNPIECMDVSTGELKEVNISQLYPVLFLSQTEIIKIAEDPDEQMKFIDKFFDFHSYRNQILTIENELEEIDKKLSESLRAYHENKLLESQSKTLDIEIERLSRQLNNPIFNEFEKLEKKDRILRTQYAFLNSVLNDVNSFEKVIKEKEIRGLSKEFLTDPALKRTQTLLKDVISFLLENFLTQEREIKNVTSSIVEEYRKWKPSYEIKQELYKKEVLKLGGDFQKLEEKRKSKEKDKENLEKRLLAIKSKTKQLKELFELRDTKLIELRKVYSDYFKVRKEKCEYFEKASNGKLKVILSESTNIDEFRKSLVSLKKGSYFREPEIEQICKNITSYDFILNLLRYDFARLNNNKSSSKYIKYISQKVEIPEEKMKNLMDHLLNTRSYEELLLLQYKAFPQDRPEIKYNIEENGQAKYESLARVSTGQKSTAMVILALSEGIMPIIIDQPEDSLDIRTIWEDMCTKLRRGKELRQFIFSTHNSSVAVASDTDKFIIMVASAIKGEIAFSGSIDNKEIREEVIQYLEGGINTYKLKYLKYDLPNKLNK